MRKTLTIIGDRIRSFIDFFYPPFSRFCSLQVFRYGTSGGGNILFDWVLYSSVYNFVLCRQVVHLGFIALRPHSAALFITFPITLMTGFLLQKYVTFAGSDLKGRVQLFRYMVVVMANLLLNYVGIKLMVEFMGLYPLASKMIVTVIATIFSYFSQKKYTFKSPAKLPADDSDLNDI